MIARGPVWIAVLVAASCGGGSGPEPDPANGGAAPILELRPAWSSSDTLLLSFPALAAADGRGRVYVYDTDAGILLFDTDGAAIRTVGRKGEGPGEYSGGWMHLTVLPGDSLLVWDSRLLRASVFEPDSGRFAYAHTLNAGQTESEILFPLQIERVGEGTDYLLAVTASGGPPEQTAGEVETWLIVRRVQADGTVVRDSLLVLSAGTAMRIVRSAGGRVRHVLQMDSPFAPSGMIVLGPRGIVHYSFSDSLWVRIFDADGEETGGFAAPRERRPVTREDIDRVVEREKDPDPDESRQEVADMIRSTAPETWPVFGRFLVDDRGRVWVSPTPGGDPSDPAGWDVFRPDGRHVGIATMPVGFAPLAIRAGRVYGVTRDSLDVPTVVALDLVGE